MLVDIELNLFLQLFVRQCQNYFQINFNKQKRNILFKKIKNIINFTLVNDTNDVLYFNTIFFTNICFLLMILVNSI